MSRQNLFGESKSDGDGILIADRFRVMPNERLPHLDSPACQAFAVQDAEAHDRPAFALVCRTDRPPRIDLLMTVARDAQPHFLWPLTWTAAHWPAAGKECFLLVFAQPGGGRLASGPDATPEPMSEDDLLQKVIRPLIPVMEELASRVVTHRAIRADNLFFLDSERSAVVLGECVSGSPGIAQPIIYETIESGMAMPTGRGPGTVTDDFYAFGVLLAVLLGGGDPCAGMSDEEIISCKLEKGSYSTLVARSRPGLQLMELLRGLLCDDTKVRWGAEEIGFWLDGRRQTMPPPSRTKAARAFEFCGLHYATLRALANGIAQNWAAGCELINSRKLTDWIRRNVSDPKAAAAVTESLVAAQRSGGRVTQDQALARVLIAADPSAPIRYRGFSAQPDALGQALALEFEKPEMIETFEGIVSGRLVNTWLEAQRGARTEVLQVKKAIESITLFLNRRGWGFGPERCLYEMNPNWPCQSSTLANFAVYQTEQLLPALERIASAETPSHDPVDSHIAAFCATRLNRLPERALVGLGEHDHPAKHRTAMLRLLANVQHMTVAPPLPGVAQWLARLLSPVIESYHNRPHRRLLAQEIEAVAARGSLVELLGLAENVEAEKQDVSGFSQAKADYAAARREIDWLEQGGMTNDEHLRKGSGQAAMLMSAVLSGVTFVFLTFLYVS